MAIDSADKYEDQRRVWDGDLRRFPWQQVHCASAPRPLARTATLPASTSSNCCHQNWDKGLGSYVQCVPMRTYLLTACHAVLCICHVACVSWWIYLRETLYNATQHHAAPSSPLLRSTNPYYATSIPLACVAASSLISLHAWSTSLFRLVHR